MWSFGCKHSRWFSDDSDGSLVWARSETVFQGGMWFSGRSTLA